MNLKIQRRCNRRLENEKTMSDNSDSDKTNNAKPDYWVEVIIICIGLILITCIAIPFEQFFQWLRTGIVPSRDIYWLINITTGIEPNSLIVMNDSSMVLSNYYQITDWVGLNKIFNFICSIHIGVITFITVYFGSIIIEKLKK